KKIIVPMNEKTMAPNILSDKLGEGNSMYTNKRPSPAHSIVPVVVGSTNLFWVISCMTKPDKAIAAPVNESAADLGTRVINNISQPASLPLISYNQVNNEITAKAKTTSSAVIICFFHILFFLGDEC